MKFIVSVVNMADIRSLVDVLLTFGDIWQVHGSASEKPHTRNASRLKSRRQPLLKFK